MRKTLIYITVLLLASCIDEDFQNTFNSSTINPEISIPVGSFSYDLKNKFINVPPSDIPGIYGTILYENSRYPLNTLAYFEGDANNLNLRITDDLLDNIESVTFHIIFRNSFPTDVYSQVLLADSNGGIIDSLFNESENNGPIKINGGETDANGIVRKESVQVIDIPFSKDRIEILQDAVFYQTTTYIQTTKEGLAAVQFFEKSKLHIISGVRIKLKLRGDQL